MAGPHLGGDSVSGDEGGDAVVTDLLRERGSLTISDLIDALGVTATAVRYRLSRLVEKGYVEREAVRNGRGRPGHRYQLTSRGLRHCGHNLADLAAVLWQELLAIDDESIRRTVIERVAKRLAAGYAEDTRDGSTETRMRAVAELFRHRRVPMEVSRTGEDLPVIRAKACPYPGLADQDRSVCEMEAIMLSELVGESLILSECHVAGGGCCTFGPVTPQPSGSTDVRASASHDVARSSSAEESS